MNIVKIIKDFLKVNPYTRPARKNTGIKGIIAHYTAVPKATAKNIRDSFNGYGITAKRYASAHYAVDKHEIRQMIPDDEIAYHAHDNSRCYPDALKPNANFSSLGVEICIEADGSFHPDTIKNAEKLFAYLLKKYNLPASRIYRHYDVTGKNCPLQWVKNPAQFTAFKANVDKILNPPKPASPAPSTVYHTIAKGDTFSHLAVKYNTTVANLQALNPKVKPTALQIGQKIVVSVKAQFHTVKSGDTFSHLAMQYKTTVAKIQALNPNVDPRRIQIGQKIRVK